MGFPWKKLKDVGKALAGVFMPPLAVAIETAEQVYGAAKGSGATKAEAVDLVYKALLQKLGVDLALLTPEQRTRVDAAVSEARDTYVAVRNAEAEFDEAKDALEALLQSFKAPQPV